MIIERKENKTRKSLKEKVICYTQGYSVIMKMKSAARSIIFYSFK